MTNMVWEDISSIVDEDHDLEDAIQVYVEGRHVDGDIRVTGRTVYAELLGELQYLVDIGDMAGVDRIREILKITGWEVK